MVTHLAGNCLVEHGLAKSTVDSVDAGFMDQLTFPTVDAMIA